MVLVGFISCGECADKLQAMGLSDNYRPEKVSKTFTAGRLDSSGGQEGNVLSEWVATFGWALRNLSTFPLMLL